MGIYKGITCKCCRHWKRDGISIKGTCTRNVNRQLTTNDGHCCESAALRKEVAEYLHEHYDDIPVLAGLDVGEAPIDTTLIKRSDVLAVTTKSAIWNEVTKRVYQLPAYHFPTDNTPTVEIPMEEYLRLKGGVVEDGNNYI